MTGEDVKPAPSQPAFAADKTEQRTKAMRLNGDLPPVTRLSRNVLAGGSAVALLLIGGAVAWTFQTSRTGKSGSAELYSTNHHDIADGISALPRDYANLPRNVPVIGPPLPGDLGKPIVAAQGEAPTAAPDQEQLRHEQERDAARVSRLFATINAHDANGAASAAHAGERTGAVSSPDDAFTQNGQERKLAFVNAPIDRRTTSPDRIGRAASPYVVQAGAVIAGALITGIRSDLPGQITAQVTENVFDSPSGRFLLVPQGARLIGIYDSQVTAGQSRVLLVWTRLIMPNGRSIVLERQQGADAAGYSGLSDEVDNHVRQLVGAALLSTLLSMGSEVNAGANQNTSNAGIIQALRQGFGNAMSRTGQELVGQQMNIQPTLTVRPGFPIRVIVNRDLVLEPYQG
ncbi:putative conjugal transfer protein trbI [Bradyrhizobium sp. ORS 285]|uniref:TrbI/VirB10 family protein n=1 Tax=Bradyrhizobium sp. ORS 285 TaxID=115808 RepID=UPI000240A546|nr:TrbI/VirB10 family protein [Bradyrhizobium sp. ORS 285]CCD84687.1 putative conjugal transfer protein trbI [Bradyrhizobium sp. ORS 285]SMX61210.1 putative conjugal transfer protein trbI [Bradyrhizobium sp. ORS 285]